ncbi:hypothetical protein [Sphingopyxis granuli]|uniref:hypothetical protein n=1 Tax=Sphingopyxis granuli TaxID=267128 RepID=UPI001BB0B8E2|nr:hypothetical protein [Sphingopyxis granuli]QUM73356.1 hypothetical protein ICN83_05570 [Sphingopyxis granuli]
MARFTSSILPQRPIVQRQAIAAAAVRSASDAAAVEEKVIAVAVDPGSVLGQVLHDYGTRLHALENPIP